MTSATPENILKTARSLFARHGLKGVSVRQICKEAGCNLASVSYHFRGKEELYRHCLEDSLSATDRMIEILSEPTSKEDFEAKLRLFLTQFYDHMVEQADVVRMVVLEMHDPSPVGQEVMDKLHQKMPMHLDQFVKTAQDKGFLNAQVNTNTVIDIAMGICITQIIFEEKVRKKLGPNAGISNLEARNSLINQVMLIFSGGIYVK